MSKIRIKIEIPKDSNIKYEINKHTGIVEVDRVLDIAVPFNYGFIPETLWEDGDALDAILIGDFSLHPGVELLVEPRALIKMYDGGPSDFKIVCALGDEKFSDFKSTIVNFLKTYKDGVVITGTTSDLKEVNKVIRKAKSSFSLANRYEY